MGLLGGRGNSTGGPGIGAGPRGPGTPEGTTFTKTKIKANELDPTGRIVGTLPFDGDAPTGESLLRIREIVESAQSDANAIERQAIPTEYRELIRDFHTSLHGGGTRAAPEIGDGNAGDAGGDGDRGQ